MNEVREQFTFYGSFFRAGKALNDKMRLQYYDAICEYALYGTLPDMSEDAVCGMMEIVMPVLDAARKKALAGRAGGDAKAEAQRVANNVAPTVAKAVANPVAERVAKSVAPNVADGVAEKEAQLVANRKQVKGQGQGQEKEQVKEQEQMLTPPTPSPQQRKADFLQFWDAYPRKIGDRTAAYRAFCEAQMPIVGILRAIEALKKTKAWMDEGGRYIPSPERWLREERWHEADELLKEPRNDLDLAEQMLRRRKEQST